MSCLSLPNNYIGQSHKPYKSRFLVQTSYTIIYAVSFLNLLQWYSKVNSHKDVFLYSETPKKDPSWKIERNVEGRQIKLDLIITHQGQCPHQVSLNLADPDFQDLTRFLSQGLLNVTHCHNSETPNALVSRLDYEYEIEYEYEFRISNQWRFQSPRSSCWF